MGSGGRIRLQLRWIVGEAILLVALGAVSLILTPAIAVAQEPPASSPAAAPSVQATARPDTALDPAKERADRAKRKGERKLGPARKADGKEPTGSLAASPVTTPAAPAPPSPSTNGREKLAIPVDQTDPGSGEARPGRPGPAAPVGRPVRMGPPRAAPGPKPDGGEADLDDGVRSKDPIPISGGEGRR
ncbi:MAG: hypothetical protein HY815_13420 [Candidatus Riflebacteria bacterium]|nr:hypothetical protein [Candidatus Riflebacteria bacterium]